MRLRKDRNVTGASGSVWEVMATARRIRRYTDEPVDDVTLRAASKRHLGAIGRQRPGVAVHRPAFARAASGGGRGGGGSFEVIEPVYGMTRPAPTATPGAGPHLPRDLRAARPSGRAHLDGVRADALPGGFRTCCSAVRSTRRCRTSCSRPAPRDWGPARPAGRPTRVSNC